jgi:phosphatidylinositol glycan class O
MPPGTPRLCAVFAPLLVVALLHVAAIYTFTGGFFLTRHEVKNVSVAHSTSPQFHKAVILLIDALRYDFALWKENATEEGAFVNKMPVFYNTLRKHPDRAHLFKFVADPPTTTMQVRYLVPNARWFFLC